jgi:hypothetical protein
MQLDATWIVDSHLHLLADETNKGASGLSTARIALETATSIAELKSDTYPDVYNAAWHAS